MPFLRGNLSFQRFSVSGFESQQWDEQHIETLGKLAAGKFETSAIDNVSVGFLGGDHLFDQEFDLQKNVINDALHLAVRVDTQQIPASHRQAWLQIELAGIEKENEGSPITKAQRKEAKEAVDQRCEVEAESGKYRKMKEFPLLWDLHNEMLYFGGGIGTAGRLCIDLLERAFEIECHHLGAGSIAEQWAIENERYAEVDDLYPISFLDTSSHGPYAWANEHSSAPDFLGNEFLMWLWWRLEQGNDTLTLVDESEVTVMMNKSIVLECPRGASGKETISAECPIALPEAAQAIRSGKLPRKTGLTVVRDDRQFDLTLQAETFGISGAKIHLEEGEEFDDDDRIEAIRLLSETTDLMLQTFCERRISADWKKDHRKMINWLSETEKPSTRKAA